MTIDESVRGPARLATLDWSAASLSTLCLLHCLALPILGASLPLLAVWAEYEWVHKAFVIAAVPISAFVMYVSMKRDEGSSFVFVALPGLVLLVLAAFAEPLHDVETPLTVIGACLLAFAHLRRWWRHAHIDT